MQNRCNIFLCHQNISINQQYVPNFIFYFITLSLEIDLVQSKDIFVQTARKVMTKTLGIVLIYLDIMQREMQGLLSLSFKEQLWSGF